MNADHDQLNILAPRAIKPKFDYLHREVQRAAGRPVTRRQALGLGGMALFAAACGSTATTQSGASASSSSSSANALAGKPLENHLEIYNWSEYDDPSTYTKFKKLPAEAKAGLTLHETYYSSNDELLAKLHAGGTSYDIIVPSQNAVAELIEEKNLMRLDKALLPNLKNLDPVVPQAVVRPDRRLPRHQGLRHHDVLLQQQDRDRRAQDHARLLHGAAEVREQGPHQPAGRRRRGGAAGADGAGPGPQHHQPVATSTR